MRRPARWIANSYALALLLSILLSSGPRQDAHAGLASVSSAREPTTVFSGPGVTYRRYQVLQVGVRVEIVERNKVGNWLHIHRDSAVHALRVEGWVMTGHMQLDPTIRFSDIPVNDTLPDASLANVRSEVLQQLYAAPIISDISPEVRAVYEIGQALGNDSHVATKIGDSLTADPLYLSLLNRDDHVLGPYDHLADTLAFFGPSTPYESVAAQEGMSTSGVFDPFWATTDCMPRETPLACEFRFHHPSIAFILLGLNDLQYMDVADYTAEMREVIEATLEAGIVPVLSTFSYDPTSEFWDNAVAYNLALIDLAREYHLPLINLWAAARPLPRYGLDGDSLHMRHGGYRMLRFDQGDEARSGAALRNLLTLQMLDELRRALPME